MAYNNLSKTSNYEIKIFNWSDIEKFLPKIIKMQIENIYKYHYPNKKINEEYVKDKLMELKKHLSNKNTYFIGVIVDSTIIGYVWCYQSLFIGERRMNINSMFVDEKYRSLGLGFKLMKEIKRIALETECNSISTHYAAFNESAGEFYKNNGFVSARVEVVQELNNNKGKENE